MLVYFLIFTKLTSGLRSDDIPRYKDIQSTSILTWLFSMTGLEIRELKTRYDYLVSHHEPLRLVFQLLAGKIL